MMLPVPRHGAWGDDLDPGGLHVFVPGLMGAGVLVSVGMLLTDAISRIRGNAGAQRVREVTASYITADVLRAVHREQEVDVTGAVRSRRSYLVGAVLFLALGMYGLVGSTWNYINPIDDGWVEDIAWVWAVSLLVVAALLYLGVVLLMMAWCHPDVPVWARRFLVHTPIGGAPRERFVHRHDLDHERADAPPARARRVP